MVKAGISKRFANIYSPVTKQGVIYYIFDRQINCISIKSTENNQFVVKNSKKPKIVGRK